MPSSDNKREVQELAVEFYEYICQHPKAREQAADRDGAHVVFLAFYQRREQEGGGVNWDAKKLNHLESLVMTRLRRRKLLKSKRYDNSLLMIFADDDGTFPPLKERATILDRVRQQIVESEQDKYGVSVVLRPDEQVQTTELGSSATCHFFIKLDADLLLHHHNNHSNDENDNGHHGEIQLESITIHGQHRKKYKLQVPFALPWSLADDPVTRAFTTTVSAKHVSLLRCSVQCNFTLQTTNETERVSFLIARYISTKYTSNVALDQALQPKTEYKKKVIRKRERTKTVLPPDEEEDNKKKSNKKKSNKKDDSSNPFTKLPRAGIPIDTRELIVSGELERVIERPQVTSLDTVDRGEESGVDHDSGTVIHVLEGYSAFWKSLLWASEHQAHTDIELFDMEQVQLQREGKSHFLLTVPGLAENRPSVLLGDTVKVFWPSTTLNLGRVNQVRQLEVRLTLNKRFAQKYSPNLDYVDVRFSLSRTTFRTSHHGVEQAESSMKALMLQPSLEMYQQSISQRLPPRILYNSEEPFELKWANRFLNPEQQAAVKNVVLGNARPMPYCIFGPPGTGKTTTVIETVYQLAKVFDQSKLLLVAPSNDAADILVERLADYFPPSELKRILAYSRSIETVPASIRNYVVELNSPGEGIAETTGGEKSKTKKNKTKKSESNNQQKQQKQQHPLCRTIMAGRIVVATVNLAARFVWMGVPKGHFDVLCIDEAGHATEPEVISLAATLMDFWKDDQPGTGQLVLAGDPRQLGPVVTSGFCRRFGLEVSYMERLMKTDVYGRRPATSECDEGKFPEELVTKLVRNYRSHSAIIKLPNEMFYDGELQVSADPMVTQNLCNWEHLSARGFPILFHGIDGENQREGNSPSWFNPQEAMQCVEYVRLLTRETRPPLKADDIGIITPYHRQAQKIRTALAIEGLSFSSSVDSNAGTAGSQGIKVGSVETFQGQERRCIIVSTVRADVEYVESDLKYNLGFVANEKRFNVSMTRAKALLIVVGCPTVLALDKDNWFPFLKYCHENKVRLRDIVQRERERDIVKSVSIRNLLSLVAYKTLLLLL